jgi:hypothetical protein
MGKYLKRSYSFSPWDFFKYVALSGQQTEAIASSKERCPLFSKEQFYNYFNKERAAEMLLLSLWEAQFRYQKFIIMGRSNLSFFKA